jgi:peptide/nickel transport system permease protein
VRASFAIPTARLPLTVLAVWAIVAAAVPFAMARYEAFALRTGVGGGCVRGGTLFGAPRGIPRCDAPLESIYALPLPSLILDAATRSLALLVGAAFLAITVGTLLGASAAVLRHRALASGALLGVTAAIAAIPSFFVAFLLQLLVIFLGQSAGHRVLPVFGFGYDEHLVLPLLAVAIPAVAVTAQVVAARLSELLDEPFVTTAHAKGLWPRWIFSVHLLPHIRPLLLESVGSGLRISVASLPILEYLFVWNGIGFISLRAIAAKDIVAFTASALVLALLFSALSLLADLRRR